MRALILKIVIGISLAACSAITAPQVPRLGETIDLYGLTGGIVRNNQIPICNGKTCFSYGDFCEIDSRYHHRATVIGLNGGNEILMKYDTNYPSPGIGNRHCISGVFFETFLARYDSLRHLSNEKKALGAKNK